MYSARSQRRFNLETQLLLELIPTDGDHTHDTALIDYNNRRNEASAPRVRSVIGSVDEHAPGDVVEVVKFLRPPERFTAVDDEKLHARMIARHLRQDRPRVLTRAA